MTPFAILLVTVSAFIHALWNLLGKRQNPSTTFFFVASLFTALLTVPVALILRDRLVLLPLPVWLLLGGSGVAEAVYFIGLAGAYRSGDMSLTYPLARALPVILVALLSATLGIGKPLSGVGIAGILLVTAGCLILPLHSFREVHWGSYLNTCCMLAGLAALGTCAYTLIDNEALRQMRLLPGLRLGNLWIALLFLVLDNLATTLALGMCLLLFPAQRGQMQAHSRDFAVNALLTGVLMTTTYGLVLWAMAYITNISYIAAFRQLSIPLGALAGILIQKEPAPPPKWLGIGVVFIGLVLVGMA